MLADNDSVRTTLINGDPELCKAFLFEAAITWAKEGQQVYYFASKQIESLPPAYHHRSEPSANALKLMTFIYTTTYDDFAGQLVKLQTFQRPPAILFIDDLDFFANEPQSLLGISRELHVARCCALILNAAQSCSQVLAKTVHLCAASFESRYASTYRKYFDNSWSVSAESTEKDSDEGRRVWMRRLDGKLALEFCKLDDALIVFRRLYETEEEPAS